MKVVEIRPNTAKEGDSMFPRPYRRLFFCLFLIIIFMVTGCSAKPAPKGQSTAGKPRYGGVLKVHLVAPVQSLDPAHLGDSSSVEVGKEIFTGLVALEPKTMAIIPGHAKSWQVKDNQVYEFELVKGARFHDGSEVVAQDFKYSLERVLDPKTASELSAMLTPIKGATEKLAGKVSDVTGIKVKDRYHLVIELSAPNPEFLYVLAHPAFSVVKEGAVRKSGADFGTQAAIANLIGSGPFKLKQWNSSQVELVANKGCFRGRPYLDGAIFRFIEQESTALNEYKAGNLDVLDRIPPGQVPSITQQYKGLTVKAKLLNMTMCGFNVKNPPFDNLFVRKAVNYAINRDDLTTALKGEAIRPKGVIPEGIPGYKDEINGYEYNEKQALEMLEQAGFPQGKGLPDIELKYNYSETNQQVAEIVQANLKDVGINVKLISMEPAALWDDLVSGKSQMFRLSWTADFPDPETFLRPLFHSAEIGNCNFIGYANPKFDQILDAAGKTVDRVKRDELYNQAHQIIMDDAVGAPLFYSTHTLLLSPAVRNFHVTPLDTRPLSKVWLAP